MLVLLGRNRNSLNALLIEKHKVGEMQLEPVRQKRMQGSLSDRRCLTGGLGEKDSLVTVSGPFHSDF